MKIRERLVAAFIIIIIIPIILIAAALHTIIRYQVNSIEQSYEVTSGDIEVFVNPMQVLNRVTRGVYNDIKSCALKDSLLLENIYYIRQLNSKLKDRYSFIVLRKDDTILFSGDDEKTNSIERLLPEFGVYRGNLDGAIYIGGKNPFLVKQQDFYFSDSSEGSIFIVTDANTVVPQIKDTLIQVSVSFVLVICLTATILVWWIYKSILRPLNTLKIATHQIKDGNLSYSIEYVQQDEIGELCRDFEEMRMRLKELIEMKMQYEVESRELISNISHDLKTPLTAIKGYAEGIIDGVADSPEKINKYLRTIYTKANDMTSLVDELSVYSKIDCNSMPYNFMCINLDHYFGDCINEITLDLELKNIDIAYFNSTEKEPKVIADVEQLKRVINNIIGNSVKYIGAKTGFISVGVWEEGEFIGIEIEDNGAGIPEKDQAYIFDRFYRTDESRNSSKGGSGLGLAIAKKIIEDHGGRIWVESEEKVGTSIFFTLKKCDVDMLEDSNNLHC